MISRCALAVGFLVLTGVIAQAEVKYIDDVMAHATAEDRKDLKRIIASVELETVKDPQTGKTYQMVKSVAKGSVFERAGVKENDYLTHGSSKNRE